MYFDLVGHAVDKLLLPLAHDLSFCLHSSLNIHLLIKVIYAEFEVVELEEELLEVELSLQELRHVLDLVNLFPEARLLLTALDLTKNVSNQL